MIRIPPVVPLTKDKEREIVSRMEEASKKILELLHAKGAISQLLLELRDALRDGIYDLYYQSVTRRKMRRKDLLIFLDSLIKAPTIKTITGAKFNHLVCYRFAQSYLKSHRSPALDDLCNEYIQNRNRLVESNLDIAIQAKNSFRIPTTTTVFDSDDIFIVACEALLDATGRYDTRWNCRFFSYATWSVISAITRFARENSPGMQVALFHHKKNSHMQSVISAYEQQLGRGVSDNELGLVWPRLPISIDYEEVAETIGASEDELAMITLTLSQKARQELSFEETQAFEREFLYDEVAQTLNLPGCDEVITKRMMEKLVATGKGWKRIL